MATMGPTSRRQAEAFAGSLLRLARLQKNLTQRDLAEAAGVPQPTIAAIEAGRRQPSWPLLSRILAAANLEPRVQLAPYDDHDDILDATDARMTAEQREHRDRVLDEFLSK
jgi:transcriptional regulator with XRE-family HTH domain